MKTFKSLTWVFLILATGCTSATERAQQVRREMEQVAEITDADSHGTRTTNMDLIKPYLKREAVKDGSLAVVYKSGPIRKRWLEMVREDWNMEDEAFKELVTNEKFNGQTFQEYYVWLPRKTDVKKLKVFQMIQGKKVSPFYVEAVDGSDTSIQSLFPFASKDIFPILVRFKRTGRAIPPLVVQVDKGKAKAFHWSRPNASKRP